MDSLVLRGQPGPAEHGFDAPGAPAVTGRAGSWVLGRPWAGAVSPFPCDGVLPLEQPAVHDDTTPDPGAKDGTKDDGRPGPRAIGCL